MEKRDKKKAPWKSKSIRILKAFALTGRRDCNVIITQGVALG